LHYVAITLNPLNTKLQPLSAEQLQTCSVCGVGKLRPTGGIGTARDEEKDMVTTDYTEYKCDNPQCCFAQSSGKAKVAAANEQAVISESTNPTTTSSPAATAAAVQSAVEAVGVAVEEDKDKGKEGSGKKASYTTTTSNSPSCGSSGSDNPVNPT
jgi:ribosomal protein S27E